MVLLITLAELSELGILGMRTSPPAAEGKDTASVSALSPRSWGRGEGGQSMQMKEKQTSAFILIRDTILGKPIL